MKLITIIKKELLDQVRDKRTIIISILMPAVVIPFVLFSIQHNVSKDDLSRPVKIIVDNNDDHIKNIILESYNNTQFINSDSPSETILKGKADLFIIAEKSANIYKTLSIYYDPARMGSALAYNRIYGIVKSYFNQSVTKLDDLEITSLTIRNEKENKTLLTLSLLLPVFLMLFAASSTMSAVIDMTSGEKERSTIEILLSCNVSHITIILGKVFAASIFGFLSILSLLTGLIISSHLYPELTGGLSIIAFTGLTNIVLITLMSFMSVLLFATAGMVIGLYSKSVKEGSILTLPVIILSSVLSSGLIASDPFSISKINLMIPILNFSSLIHSVLYDHYDLLMIMICFSFNLIYVILFLIISNYLIKKETVIFRS